MAYSTLTLEIADNVALIRLNRPEALNALNAALMHELAAALTAADADIDVRCIVLTGSEKAFAAGADVREMADKTFVDVFSSDFFGPDADDILRVRKPIIAAVSGFALGGGCELAMMCDFIIASDTAKFGQPEINLGIVAGMGGTQRLTRFVGKSKSMDMHLTGRFMDAAEAERSGLVSRVVPAADLIDEAMKIARGEYFVFLDNDILVFQKSWLESLRAFLQADEKRAMLAPKLLFPWPPFAIECCGAAISPRGRVEYCGRGAARESLSQPQKIQCAISAAWMMPRKIYDNIGGLDEIYSPVQYEDLDYCYRAREAGYEVWALPSVELFHFEHTTTAGSGDINFKYVTAKNALTFKKRWSDYFQKEFDSGWATTEENATWKTLPKLGVEDIDWRALIQDFS